ncbi:MAG: DUF4405 domain-containing protein [Desulfobacterales bacterium]|nr:DUF4405 domain-containing protein [Desulfobacterales bacterium]
MNMRRITSLTAALAFLMMTLTSIILYIVPHGRVAYWADWHLWGLTKTDWGNIHTNLGLLFLLALGLHIYYNWKPLMAYLKNRARQMKVFTPEFNAALVVTLVFTVGTYFLIPPFSWVMALSDQIKDAGTEKYGEPPYGHAELSSLKTFTQKMKLDLAKSLQLLEQAGYEAGNESETLAEIGKKYGVAPQAVYMAMQAAALESPQTAGVTPGMPAAAPPGTGNLTLADLCARYGLHVKQAERVLKQKGFTVSADLTLKKIAAQNQTSPADIYTAIRGITSR